MHGVCRRHATVWLCLALIASLPAAAQTRDLTPALIFGGSLDGLPPQGFRWSPDGSRLAFTRKATEETLPTIHVLDAAGGATTALPALGEPSSKEPVTLLQWYPSNEALLISLGGDLYEQPVPRAGAAGAARRLTRTEAPEKDAKLSPDGRLVGFARDHNITVLDPASGLERVLTGQDPPEVSNGEVDWVYDEEFNLSSAWWWSPDSTRIAYLQFDEREVPRYPLLDWSPIHPTIEWMRYPKAGDRNATVRAGVVAVAGWVPQPGRPDAKPSSGDEVPALYATRWLDTGADDNIYLPRVAWTGDGRSVAVQKLDRGQKRLELLLCDPNTGDARRVLEETDPHWINILDDSSFLPPEAKTRGFIWGSERDGFRHLYLHDEAGRLARRLTQGAWVVDGLKGVDAKQGWVYFTAAQKDPLERHLYRIKLDGSGMTRLTSQDGWHEVVVAPAGGAYVDTWSTINDPPVITVRRADGSAVATLDAGISTALADYKRGRAEFLTVPASDGTKLPAVVTRPAGFDPARRHPVLIYVYGGPHAQNVRNAWGGTRGLWHQMMAAQGYIVWTLDNRGAWGRGHAWETPIHRKMGTQELSDQLAGVEWLKAQPWADPARIGIWGWSYGGYMALVALCNSPGAFKMGVSVAPVTDWKDYDTIYTERYMELPASNPEGYRDGSPVHQAASLADPLLLVHGSADDNVHMQNSVHMLDALVKATRPVEFMLYPRKNHGILGKDARTHLFEKITSFVKEHL